MVLFCTWVEHSGTRCIREATRPQLDRYGKRWANLCEEHDAMLDRAITNGEVKNILAYWIAASGGPKKLAKSMV